MKLSLTNTFCILIGSALFSVLSYAEKTAAVDKSGTAVSSAVEQSVQVVPIEQGELTGEHQGIEITVNINMASVEELATLLSGVGTVKAQRIVDYRTEHGKFNNVDELLRVKGIGKAILEKNRGRILL